HSQSQSRRPYLRLVGGGRGTRVETRLLVVKENPFSGRMRAGAEQFGAPGGLPRSLGIPARRRRRCGANLPAHPRCGEVARGVWPDEKQGYSMPFSRERETTRGGKIERSRVAHDLPDHAGEVAAAQP